MAYTFWMAIGALKDFPVPGGWAKTWFRIGLLLVALLASAEPGQSQQGPIRVCPLDSSLEGCDQLGLAEALRGAEDGSTIILSPGEYQEAAVLRASGVTIRAEPGAHVRDVAAEGKAALVIKGNNIVIQGLECSGITVPDGNGACIRAEGQNLTLRGVYFHDSQEGLLGGHGVLIIEDSHFERLGGDRNTKVGRAHGIYASSGVERLELRRSKILSSKEEGHEVKSRARTTIIEDNVIASLDGMDSRLIDVPNGGVIEIRNNVLEIGPRSSNPDLIGIGLERGRNSDLDHALNSALIEGNTVIIDFIWPTQLLNWRDFPEPLVRNNTIIGGTPYPGDDNTWFIDRKAAGLAAYPTLEHWREAKPETAKGADKASGNGLLLDREQGSAQWKGQDVKISNNGFALLALLSGEADRILPFEEILDRLEADGILLSSGADSDRREQLIAMALSLRRAFRKTDRSFDAIVYLPGRGFGWRESQ